MAREVLGVRAAKRQLVQIEGRTFLEVERFDRLGAHGHSPVWTLASLNLALIGRASEPWPLKAADLHRRGWLPSAELERIRRLWWFGRLIANTDMHDGNLAFVPGLALAPVYDMLPMRYAPTRTGEVPSIEYEPPMPRPEDQDVWLDAHRAALCFWERAATDTRLSAAFRAIAGQNSGVLRKNA